MKAIKLTVLLLFLPIIFYAQTLTGLWMGSVTNDSTTIRKDQSFEVVLTQYKDKVYGYSRSTFTVNDTLYYIVKRVKGSIEGDVCEVKDDDIVSYNFKGRLDKGVKMVTTFHFDHGDSTWRMDGDWKTNKTKKYYSISGKATLNQEKDITKSKIFPHLEELKLADDVDFYKEAKQAEEIAKKEQEKKKQELAKSTKPIVSQPKETKTSANDVAVNKKPETMTKPVPQPKETALNSTTQPEQPASKDQSTTKTVATNNTAINTPAKSGPIAQVQQSPVKPVVVEEKRSIASAQSVQPSSKDQNATKTVAANNTAINAPAKSEPIAQVQQSPAKETIQQNPEPKKSEPLVVTKAVEQKKEPVIETPKPETKGAIVAADKKEPDKQQPVSMFSETRPATASAALFIKERAIAAPQVVNFKSDSLELALYDNGEVDGDTVSVLLNGQLILAKQGLKASAIKKTIYAPANNNDSLTMVLYAENLGKYPPNTGLLIIHDGNDTYQVRFSADLQQNAAVIFKRRKN
ncbi:MAG: hypothetical protein E6H09_19305 [Bacteroidetes bacterium]|nr:MAG: hypothetical protein E6H09_19305 [Bacteroidota bacterium]